MVDILQKLTEPSERKNVDVLETGFHVNCLAEFSSLLKNQGQHDFEMQGCLFNKESPHEVKKSLKIDPSTIMKS